MAYDIVFPVFPGITQLDFAGPAQFLSRLPDAKVHVAARQVAAIETDSGFSILPDTSFAACPQARLVCVPGGLGVADALADEELVTFVKRQAEGADFVTSVCTGAFILGRAGLLEGRRATTHWGYAHLLPLVGATHEDARIVADGNLVTAGGVTAGIDFALALVAKIAGEATARAIQLGLEYDPQPPFDGGHPRSADPATTQLLRERRFDRSAAEMESALKR